MVIKVVKLSVMEFCATVIAASHNVVANFVSTPATRARVGESGVDAVSNSTDGYSQPLENFCSRSGEVRFRFVNDREKADRWMLE
jgi:hypothetical protein